MYLYFAYFRTYDTQKPSSPIDSVCVSADEPDSFHESSITLQRALGDTAVGFDFGPMIEFERKAKLSGQPSRTEKYWPVYVLCGGGDVYRILSKLDNRRFVCMNKLTLCMVQYVIYDLWAIGSMWIIVSPPCS